MHASYHNRSALLSLFQGNFMAGSSHFGMHTPPDSLPSSPLGAFSPFGAFPFSPLSPVESESSISPMRHSYRSSMFPRCQPRQLGLPPAALQPAEIPSMGSLFTDPRWTGVNPLFGMWNDPLAVDYMQQPGLAQLLPGKFNFFVFCCGRSLNFPTTWLGFCGHEKHC